MSLLPLQVVLVVTIWSVFVQQLARTRRSTAGLSLPTWSGFVAGGLVWAVYGLAVDDPLQLVVNIPTVLMSLVICRAAWPAAPHRERRNALVVAGTVIGASVIAATTFGVLGASVIAVGLTVLQLGPQLVAVVRRPDVSGVSVSAWLTMAGNQSLWIVYGVLDGQPTIVVNSTLVTATSLAIALVARRHTTTAAAGEPAPETDAVEVQVG